MTDAVRPRPTHTWFGPSESPLFGSWLTPEDGGARAVVVIVPPVGLEMLIAHRSLRVLADELVARGFAAFRMDYRGTGDSAGPTVGRDQVAGWLASIDEAVAYARASGARNVFVIGLRLGATLAASLTEQVDGLVMWDPCTTGARFLREEGMLFRVGVKAVGGEPEPGTVQGPGTSYSVSTVADLEPLSVDAVLADEPSARPTVRAEVGRVLLAPREESSTRSFRALAETSGIDLLQVRGHVALFDWAALTVPVEAITRIADWLEGIAPAGRDPLRPELRTSAVVARTGDGREVRERVVSLGPSALFGIVSEVEGVDDGALVLANAAPPAVHVGPARIWVEVAREHAAERGPVLRFDGYGTGESPGGEATTYPASYTASVVAELAGAIRAARGLGREVAVSGLCAAGWAALRAADAEQVDVVLAINPSVWDVRPAAPLTAPWPPPRELMAPGGPAMARGKRVRRRMRHEARRLATWILPEAVWWRLARRGLIEAPAGMIVPLVRRGTRVRLLLGVRESARFTRLRGTRSAARLGSSGLLSVGRADEVDHALMSAQARSSVVNALKTW